MVESPSKQGPPWLFATADEVHGLDFEAPIAGSTSAEAEELSQAYYAAIRQAHVESDPSLLAADRVFGLMAAVTGMYLKPEDRYEPYGATLRGFNSRRSATPADFRGPHLGAVAAVARQAHHPVLRARAADLAWLLDRKQADLAHVAIAAYVEIVQKVDTGDLRFRFGGEDGALHHDACGYLRRALLIGRVIKAAGPEIQPAMDLTVQLRKRAASAGAARPLLWFSKLDLALSVSPPFDIATDVEQALSGIPDKDNWLLVDFWRLIAEAYGLAKQVDQQHRCHSEAAEVLVCEAEISEANGEAAILVSHKLRAAIAELRVVPGKRERRKELRHRLIEIQELIPEELALISIDLELEEIAKQAAADVSIGTLTRKLFLFASFAASPDPDELGKSALEALQSNPVPFIFDSSHHDHEGKVIYCSESEGAGAAAIRTQIIQIEAIRRQVEAFGSIEPARAEICAHHFVSEDDLRSLLQHSPFIPSGHLETFCRGFARFFQSDYVSAVYILAPQLENSLRHVLKLHGHDVSKLDNATQTQEDRTISSLFQEMRAELDGVFGVATTTEIDNLFLSKPGPHLRHTVAHGLLQDAGPYGSDAIYGCWFIFRLCMVPLFVQYKKMAGC